MILRKFTAHVDLFLVFNFRVESNVLGYLYKIALKWNLHMNSNNVCIAY